MTIKHTAPSRQRSTEKVYTSSPKNPSKTPKSEDAPHSITGALNPSRQTGYLSGLGWLTLTWASGQCEIGRVLRQYEMMTGDSWADNSRTKHYKFARKSLQGTLVGWSPNNSRSMISISQTAIEQCGAEKILPFAAWLLEICEARATRVDCSITDYSHTMSTDLIWAACDAGNYVGTSKKFQPYIEYEMGSTVRLNDGITIGSRESEVFYRAYNKMVESKGETDAFRLEGEYKGAVAQSSLGFIIQQSCTFVDTGSNQFVARVSLPDYQSACASVVLGRIDFRLRGARKHIEDCPRLDWWETVHKEVYVKPYKQATVRKKIHLYVTLDWFYRCMASLFAVLSDFSGESQTFASDLYAYGKENMTRRHQVLLEQALNSDLSGPNQIDIFGEIQKGPFGAFAPLPGTS